MGNKVKRKKSEYIPHSKGENSFVLLVVNLQWKLDLFPQFTGKKGLKDPALNIPYPVVLYAHINFLK